MTAAFLIALAALGLLVGVLIGAVGIGGVLLVPALHYLWGVDVHVAVATAMWVFVFAGAMGAISYARRGSIDWGAAAWLCAGAVPAAFVATFVMAATPPQALELVIAALIVFAGVNALRSAGSDTADRETPLTPLALATIGVVVGFGSSLTGTGGPLLLLPVLMWLRLPVLGAVGLSQAIQFPISLFATAGNVIGGLVDFTMGGVIAVTVVVGVALGARLAHAVPTKLLQRGVAIMLLATGAMMVGRIAWAWLTG